MPKGIRPTQNKIRKAIFDILGDIEGSSFLELFAGSAAVGFEAVSKGAKELTLAESNRSCQLSIKKNIESLGLLNCTFYPLEADRAIELLCRQKKQFDIIFLDPPYNQDFSKKTLQCLRAYDILAPNGFAIAQHSREEHLPEEIGNLLMVKQSFYGDTVLTFYKKSTKSTLR